MLGRLNSAGDTIVEIMVVLAVLGLALSISYATANRSLQNARQAQENSLATEYAQQQVEEIRSLAGPSASQIYNLLAPFCITNDSVNVFSMANQCNGFDPSGYYTVLDYNCGHSSFSGCSTVTNKSNAFLVNVTWPDLQGDGTDSVTLIYRVYPGA